jgi:hypothetical protein
MATNLFFPKPTYYLYLYNLLPEQLVSNLEAFWSSMRYDHKQFHFPPQLADLAMPRLDLGSQSVIASLRDQILVLYEDFDPWWRKTWQR